MVEPDTCVIGVRFNADADDASRCIRWRNEAHRVARLRPTTLLSALIGMLRRVCSGGYAQAGGSCVQWGMCTQAGTLRPTGGYAQAGTLRRVRSGS